MICGAQCARARSEQVADGLTSVGVGVPLAATGALIESCPAMIAATIPLKCPFSIEIMCI